jgi:peptidoglycan-associated lipoprotein
VISRFCDFAIEDSNHEITRSRNREIFLEENLTQRLVTRATQIAVLSLLMIVAGCGKKKPVAPPPPPPPPPPAPTASISANPATINAGQSTQLSWQTENATDVAIDGIGKVQASGSQTVNPTDSITYRLTATGPGGSQEATTRVTVNRPAPVEQQAPPPSLSDQELFNQNVKDAFFDYDSYSIRPADSQQLQSDALFLTQHPNWKVLIEGHCDERGSTEYNMALGDSRAQAAKQALVAAGVNASRINTTSFGKEKPFCTESNEQCWQQNRRAHMVLAQ